MRNYKAKRMPHFLGLEFVTLPFSILPFIALLATGENVFFFLLFAQSFVAWNYLWAHVCSYDEVTFNEATVVFSNCRKRLEIEKPWILKRVPGRGSFYTIVYRIGYGPRIYVLCYHNLNDDLGERFDEIANENRRDFEADLLARKMSRHEEQV